MKIKIANLLVLLFICNIIYAQNPKWFKKARKAQVTVITYNDKNVMQQAQGYFISETGKIVTEYDIMKGAVKGNIVDADGKEYKLTNVEGANSLYNVAVMQSSCEKSASPILAAKLSKGNLVYIMPICSTDKKAECIEDTITEVQEFEDEQHPYYTLSKSIDNRLAGCPVFSEAGELVGHLQPSAKGSDKPAYVLGVQYCNSLKITALDANNADLNSIQMQKRLPEDESQAITYLFLMNKQNKELYEEHIKMFIEKFPTNTSGYVQLAELKASQQEYKAAEEIYAQALTKQLQNEDELHHSYAKLLYKSGLQAQPVAEGWDMEHALKEARAAYSCNPLPLYTALEGLCLYATKSYEESCEKFLSLSQTNMRSAEYFIYAAQCKEMLNAPTEEIYALEDSAVNCYKKPYPAEAATYIYLRGKTLAKMGKYREAVSDMNEFEHLASGQVTAVFCYEREQMEMQCRQFKNALNDIERAVKLAPTEPLFRAEEAVVNYRVGQLDEAIVAAKEAIKLDENFPDAHRILGICLRDQGKVSEARKSLQRAIELGDESAKGVLDNLK